MQNYSVEHFVSRMEMELRAWPNMDKFIIPSTQPNLDATLKLAKERFPQAVRFKKFERLIWLECAGIQVVMKHEGPNEDLIDIERD